MLSELWGEDEKIITIEQIQRKTADFFTVKLWDMRAKNRTKAVVFPRQIATYPARQLTPASLAEVGRGPAVYVWLRLLADRAGVVHTSAARLTGELRFPTAMIERDLQDLERARYIHAEPAARRRALAAIVVVR